jgi:uncharacterized membrane protein YvlD (DUF360 family)
MDTLLLVAIALGVVFTILHQLTLGVRLTRLHKVHVTKALLDVMAAQLKDVNKKGD